MRPAGFGESRLWVPAHGEHIAAVQHPGPVDTLVDFRGKVLDFGIGEMLAGGEDSAEQQRRINGRDFALPLTLAAIHINEVVVETVLVRKLLPDESERGANAGGNLFFLPVTARIADA